MPLPGQPFPPSVPGVSQGGPQPPNPMERLAQMFQARPGNAMLALTKALNALREAGQADPRLRPIVGEAIRILTQGIEKNSSDQDGRSPTGRGDADFGPSPGGIMTTSSPD